MVIGLERFREHFRGLEDTYVLIGGSACDITIHALGGAFRVTKDLDIVLCVEARTDDFARAFWRFIKEGSYAIAQRSSADGKGRRCFYRFQNPQKADYPKMLELLSRRPEWLELPDDIHVTHIPLSYDRARSKSVRAAKRRLSRRRLAVGQKAVTTEQNAAFSNAP